VDLALHIPGPVRLFVVLAAMVVAGTGLAARYVKHGEASTSAVAKAVRTQEVQAVSIDTPYKPRDERRIPGAELRSLLVTKPGDLLDEQALVHDRKAIQDALVARGYLTAHVDEAHVTFTKNGGAYVVFDVARGPMYRFRTITVTGPGAKDAEVVTIATGDEALPVRIERAKQTLADAANLSVEVVLHEDEKTATVDVDFVTH
jgi:outer membrane protein assembly factor BamA